MKQNELRPPAGANKDRKRIGRGHGSGNVKTGGKGQKGQNSRTGGGVRIGFEGGQNPLIQRLPFKRGFKNTLRTEYEIVNVSALSDLEGSSDVTPERLLELGLIDHKTSSGKELKVKLLGDGEITAPLRVRVHKASAQARAKVEAAGGSVEEIG